MNAKYHYNNNGIKIWSEPYLAGWFSILCCSSRACFYSICVVAPFYKRLMQVSVCHCILCCCWIGSLLFAFYRLPLIFSGIKTFYADISTSVVNYTDDVIIVFYTNYVTVVQTVYALSHTIKNSLGWKERREIKQIIKYNLVSHSTHFNYLRRYKQCF